MISEGGESMSSLALKLIVHKGGTLRLRVSELKAMAGLVLTIIPNQANPDVVHFGIITKEEAETQVATFKALLGDAISEKNGNDEPK